MKKFVAAFLFILLSLTFSGCTADASGRVAELISADRSAVLGSGAEVSLKFSGDTAALTIKSRDETSAIQGRYIADDDNFVIFVPEIGQNYCFSYTPRGNELELGYDGSSIVLRSDEISDNALIE